MDDQPGEPQPTRREERAARARAEARRDAPKKALKFLGVLVVVILVVAGIVWGISKLPKDPGAGHIHPGFKLMIQEADGNYSEMQFSHQAFDLQSTKFTRCHLHVGETYTYVMHIEGKLGITLQECFREWAVDMSGDKFEFHKTAQGGRVVANNSTHEWQLWVDHCGDGADNWVRDGKYQKYKPVQHDRMLIVYAPRGSTMESLNPVLTQVPTEANLGFVGKDTCS